MDASEHFRGKKITVMGLGLLGRGVGDAAYLASCGAELIVTDLKSADELAESLERLKKFLNITYILGEHRLEDFRNRDFILKAAGVPLDSPYIAEAEKNGIPIKMSASWFVEIANIPTIGVTGTRGKSTVTYMIKAILDEAGQPNVLGGNIRGVSTLALLPEVTPEQTAILELDSWQLQGFGDAHLSPSLAVFTTFFPDHLNYYHNDLNRYFADKTNIFFYQRPGDVLIVGSQVAPRIIEDYGEEIESEMKVIDEKDLPADWQLRIPGKHNRYNAALAFAAVRAIDISDAAARAALESFNGVEGRLQLIRTVDGVDIYNDTNSTTPDATLAALEALGEDHAGKILLIMGGADKGLDMNRLVEAAPRFAKRIALLSGTGTDTIRDSLPDAQIFDNLAMAFEDVRAHAEPGDVILFSPAFASFGLFKNEYDRGDQFNTVVHNLSYAG